MPGIDDNISISTQAINIEPSILIDAVSDTDFYIGTSRSFNNPGAANWRIKRVWQVGTVWLSGYANGDQGFTFIWDSRIGYVYS
jgi:hypothetical protein